MPVYIVPAALAVSMSLPLLVYSIAYDRAPSRRVTRDMQSRLAGGDLRRLVISRSPAERVGRPLLHLLGRVARRFSPSGMVVTTERRIELSGSDWVLERFLLLKLVLAGALFVAGLLAASPLLALGAAIVGYLGPDIVLSRMAKGRQLAIGNALPDMLDQLTICVEAGLGFDSAMARTAKSGQGPLAREITRLLQDLRVGVPRASALEGMLRRTDVPELRQFVHAVIQAESYGVPVSRVLRSQSSEQREKRRFRAEERAMKLPVKVIFPLVFCIMPVLFIVVIGPAFINLTGGLS